MRIRSPLTLALILALGCHAGATRQPSVNVAPATPLRACIDSSPGPDVPAVLRDTTPLFGHHGPLQTGLERLAREFPGGVAGLRFEQASRPAATRHGRTRRASRTDVEAAVPPTTAVLMRDTSIGPAARDSLVRALRGLLTSVYGWPPSEVPLAAPLDPARVRFASVRWSAAQLGEWYDVLRRPPEIRGVHMSSIDASDNQIVFIVASERERLALGTALDSIGVPCGLVAVGIGPPVFIQLRVESRARSH